MEIVVVLTNRTLGHKSIQGIRQFPAHFKSYVNVGCYYYLKIFKHVHDYGLNICAPPKKFIC